MIAIVPMKAVSERVPGKNMREFNGKPLFYWIFKTLHNSKLISEVILTTDNVDLADKVLQYFPNVKIYFRPKHLLGNHITANALIEHVLEKHEKGHHFLYTHSTNPLLKTETIDEAIKIYHELFPIYDTLMGVTKHKMRLYDQYGTPMNHDPRVIVPSQELKPVFEDNSNMYMFSRELFPKTGRVGANPYLFEINKLESIDIDYEEDFILAERIMQINED